MSLGLLMMVAVKVLLTGYIVVGLWYGLFHWWLVPLAVSIKETATPKIKETVRLPITTDYSAIGCAKVLARREAAHLRYTLSGEDEYAEIQASLRARR
jgi:hypothetical protein